MARNNKLNILIAPFKLIYALIMAIIYTFILSLPKNIKKAKVYAFNKEKRNEINRKVKQKK